MRQPPLQREELGLMQNPKAAGLTASAALVGASQD